MNEIIEDYGDVIVGAIAVLELIALITEVFLLGSNPGSLGNFIDVVTNGYL